MILSHRHKFIFIKGIKVAGTSVEIALASFCGPDDIVTPLYPIDERLRLAARNYSDDRPAELAWLEQVASGSKRNFKGEVSYYNHMPLSQVLSLQGELPEYRVIFVERNPYAKVLSWLDWRHQKPFYKWEEERVAKSKQEIMAVFDERIVTVRNIERYRLPNGEVPARGWRYETLESDLAEFASSIGEPVPELPHVKRGLMANTLEPREWLSSEQIAEVNRVFAEEFTEFGYSML